MQYRNAMEAFVGGIRALLPLTPGVVPFGLVAGILTTNMGMSPGTSLGMTALFYSGSAQMVALQLMNDQVIPLAIVLTCLVINLRFMMYSASLAPHFKHLPRRLTWPLAYLSSDQSFAICIIKLSSGELGRFAHQFYAGTAVSMWLAWMLSVAAGVFLGSGVPPSWSLEFAIPLSFLALLVPSIRNSAGLAAAVVGGLVAVLAIHLPYNLGMILASLCGIASGVIVERLRPAPAPVPVGKESAE
ncbi:AzlC family ABC transporter permease [Pseudomonas sp. LRF_L74]|uniref:AzlC family ABC transporter permease n=1 Tax=Pseudomonas sp. LRF_L74 TaxID=3369422 RepID=UPI003F61E12B